MSITAAKKMKQKRRESLLNKITQDELRQMRGKEGIILMGCGEPLDEWEEGINEWLTEEGILQEGTRFTDISSFKYRDLTCLLFPMTDDVKLNTGKLAVWRVKTHEVFGSTWLSDFQVNQLGMEEFQAEGDVSSPKEAKEQDSPKPY